MNNTLPQELLEYFSNDEMASSIWLNKYALKDNQDNLLEKTPKDMHKRLAKAFYEVDKKYQSKKIDKSKLSKYGKERKDLTEEAIFNLFNKFKYVIPGGSVMYGVGNYKPISVSNCFVIASPEDSICGIFKTGKEQASLFKRRGGVGFDISTLRPKNSKVNNSAHFSTGSASFMDLYSQITNTIGEYNRRGALMLTMSINHPDVQDFIEKKQDLTKVTGANISIKITDEFMSSVQQNKDYLLRFPINLNLNKFNINIDKLEYNDLVCLSEEDHYYIKKVKAKDIWNLIIHCAWNTAEPGVIFEDKMINYAPDGVYSNLKMVSTNPCGEIGMEPYNSCRLIHINLSSFVKNEFEDNAFINFDSLYKVAYETTYLGDDLVDIEINAVDKIINCIKEKKNKEELEEVELWNKINDEAKYTRRCGVGFLGLSDMIAKLNLKFCTEESNSIVEKVMKTMFEAELDATIDLAISRGSFPGFNSIIENKNANDWYKFVKKDFPNQYKIMKNYGRRNLSFSTVAPTGTVSLLAQCSSGIEPTFLASYVRRKKCMNDSDRVDFIDNNGVKFTEYLVIHPTFKNWILKKYPDINFETLKEKEINKLFKESPWYQSTAPEISSKERVKLQGICQKYITHSISSTINLPKNTKEEEISQIYFDAWQHNNKGQTIYRDGCRDGILVSKSTEEKPKEILNSKAPKRPKELEADYYEIKSEGKSFAILIGLYNNKPYEVFAFELTDGLSIKNHKGKIVKEKKMHYTFISEFVKINNLQLQNDNILEKAVTLYASQLLRHGVGIKYIIKTSEKINDGITSFTKAISRILSLYIEKEELSEKCPECGGRLVREGGCIHCLDCTYSKCM